MNFCGAGWRIEITQRYQTIVLNWSCFPNKLFFALHFCFVNQKWLLFFSLLRIAVNFWTTLNKRLLERSPHWFIITSLRPFQTIKLVKSRLSLLHRFSLWAHLRGQVSFLSDNHKRIVLLKVHNCVALIVRDSSSKGRTIPNSRLRRKFRLSDSFTFILGLLMGFCVWNERFRRNEG